MFGLIVAGRPVSTNLLQVDQSKFVFNLENASSINHIVVFLLGPTPFPQNYGATVHFHYHSTNQWVPLGVLTNEKPSAVFKLSQTTKTSTTDLTMTESDSTIDTCQLGISIESLDQIYALDRQIHGGAGSRMVSASSFDSLGDLTGVVAKVVENFYNFAIGFAKGGGELPFGAVVLGNLNAADKTFFPVKCLVDWYEKVVRRLKDDPNGNFLMKQ